MAAERPDFKGKAVCGSDSVTVVFVLGESLRAANLQVNGYPRATTPLLCKEENVVSLPNVYTDYTLTHLSIPHIMTRSDEQNPDRAYTERSFVSLLKQAGYRTSWITKQAGYRTSWITNQEQVSTFAYFMNECDTLVYVNGEKSSYNLEKWLDGDMLPHYGRELVRQGTRQAGRTQVRAASLHRLSLVVQLPLSRQHEAFQARHKEPRNIGEHRRRNAQLV